MARALTRSSGRADRAYTRRASCGRGVGHPRKPGRPILRRFALRRIDPALPAPPMNQIASLLPLSNIALDLDAGTKVRLFEEMGILFERTAGISRATVAASLAAREKLGSTGLGQGI